MRCECEQHAIDEVKHDDRGRCDSDAADGWTADCRKKAKRKKKEKRKPALGPDELETAFIYY